MQVIFIKVSWVEFVLVPASASVKVQYTAPAGTQQIHDSKTIASKMTQSTQAALSMKQIVDQAELKLIQPSVIVNGLGEPANPSKGSTFLRLDFKALWPWILSTL